MLPLFCFQSLLTVLIIFSLAGLSTFLVSLLRKFLLVYSVTRVCFFNTVEFSIYGCLQSFHSVFTTQVITLWFDITLTQSLQSRDLIFATYGHELPKYFVKNRVSPGKEYFSVGMPSALSEFSLKLVTISTLTDGYLPLSSPGKPL